MKAKDFFSSLNYKTVAVVIIAAAIIYRYWEPLKAIYLQHQHTAEYSLLGALVYLVIPTLNALRHNTADKESGPGEFFVNSDLMHPPQQRPAYSDRMAYIMGELADMAYYAIEPNDSLLEEFAEKLNQSPPKNKETLLDYLREFVDESHIENLIKVDKLKAILKEHDFEYIGYFNRQSIQGFVCINIGKDNDPYVVVSFRGTEKKLGDWLTDAHAVPMVLEPARKDREAVKVHSGFYNGFSEVKQDLQGLLETARAKIPAGKTGRTYITGHSLGGALAMVATRELFPDTDGACYTYGCPRVANYSYFDDVKTPIYRIVNSSDIVPRVPPGAFTVVIQLLLKGLKSVFSFSPMITDTFGKLEAQVDKLNGYRHFGDLRYLTDVAGGQLIFPR